MTFYNVISGILFVNACQAFFTRLGTAQVWYAVSLLLIILSEALSTSDLVERRAVPYDLELKILDFATFGVLIWALLVLSPFHNNLGVDVRETLWGVDRPAIFWALLTVYWLITDLWNRRAGQYSPEIWKPRYITFMKWRWLPFVLLALISFRAETFASITAWPGLLASILMVIYISLKFKGRKEAGRVLANPQGRADG